MVNQGFNTCFRLSTFVMINAKLLATISIAAVATILMGNTVVVAPAFASSSSTHEFHHDVKQFLQCIREHGKTHISRSDFVDCLTNYFKIHISKHTEKHL